MLKKHSQLFISILMLVDLGLIVAAWSLAYEVRFHFWPFPPPASLPEFATYFKFFPIVIIIFIFSVNISGLYELQGRYDSRFKEYYRIFITVSLTAILAMASEFFYRPEMLGGAGTPDSRLVMIYFWALGFLLISISHRLSRMILRYLRRHGYNLRHILIVGDEKVIDSVAKTFSRHPESGLKVVGILMDGGENMNRDFYGFKVIGAVDDLKNILSTHTIDQVFLAFSGQSFGKSEKIIEVLGDEPVAIKYIPDVMHYMWLNAGVEDFAGVPILSFAESPMYGWNRLIKRAFDVIFSIIFLILLSPLMAVIAVLVKLDSPGPIIFKQKRMSINGEPFFIYKFRSMKMNAEADTGAIWASKDDDRRSRLGEFLRKYSLDELPQFYNSLKGDMSIIGPRPERPVFVEEFKKDIPKYMLRHKMKAGITGWAQVNGWRGNSSLEKRIEYDLYYIENWSLLFDVKIMWLTAWKIFVDENAY